MTQGEAPSDDALETAWRTCYGVTCNPTRINPTAMSAQLPERFWKGLPESCLITPLTQGVRGRVGEVIDSRRHMAMLPMADSLRELAQAAATYAGCEVHLAATQTILGVARRMPASGWWANSQATRKIWPANRLLSRSARC